MILGVLLSQDVLPWEGWGVEEMPKDKGSVLNVFHAYGGQE